MRRLERKGKGERRRKERRKSKGREGKEEKGLWISANPLMQILIPYVQKLTSESLAEFTKGVKDSQVVCL